MVKNELVEYLKNELSSVYCDTCDAVYCEDCYRKNMNWGISENKARDIINTILEKLAKNNIDENIIINK